MAFITNYIKFCLLHSIKGAINGIEIFNTVPNGADC